jgi:8-oxo-dGTP pyrophosphatase MutT (NUDIX family)
MQLFHYFRDSLQLLLSKKTVGVRIILFKPEDSTTLLIKHTYTPGWHTVGGGVDARENPLEAIERECQEEAGITLLEKPRLFSVYHNPRFNHDDYVILYVAEKFTQRAVTSPEISEEGWFALDNLPADITPATLRRLKEYLGQIPITETW